MTSNIEIRGDIANADQGEWTEIPTRRVRPRKGLRTKMGIEIEFNHPEREHAQPRIVRVLQEKGLPTVHAWNTPGYWSMKSDPTVSGGELVSPILTGSDRSIDDALKAVQTVVECGGFTGQRVGMHMHFGIRGFSPKQMLCLVDNFCAVDDMLCDFAGPDRVGDNAYNRRMPSYLWGRLREWAMDYDPKDPAHKRDSRPLWGEREYNHCPAVKGYMYNFAAVNYHGTVEVRSFGATLKLHRIRAWIRVIQAVIAAARAEQTIPTGDYESLLGWLTDYGLDEHSITVFRKVLNIEPVGVA